jgi:DNA-binding MarR family transcriptional regulator
MSAAVSDHPRAARTASASRAGALSPDLAHDLRLAVMRLARRTRQERGDHGLPLGQLSALAVLDRQGPMTAGALAQQEQVRPPSMTRVLATLAEAGYVDRTPDPHDGRVVLISLTDSARRLLRDDRRRRDEWMASRLRELDPEQRAALAAALPVLEVLADS